MAKNQPKPASDETAAEAQPQRTNTIIGGSQLPRTPKSESGIKPVYLKFEDPADIEVYKKLEAEAKAKRYPVDVYILIKLSEIHPASAPAPISGEV